MPASSQGLQELAASKNVARQRLKIVLVQDRAEANRGILEKLKDELIRVLARYAEFDAGSAEVRIVRSETESTLLARVPLRSLKRIS
jgi:cell division topological specificity factor